MISVAIDSCVVDADREDAVLTHVASPTRLLLAEGEKHDVPTTGARLVAGLLQLFLGGFGIGRFYLGYTNIGVIQIVVTILTCGIWLDMGLIDAILIISGNVPDANGRALRA